MSKLTAYLPRQAQVKGGLLLLTTALLLTACNIPTTGSNISPTATPSTQPASATKEYRSEFMKISLQIPEDWQIEDGNIGINIIKSEGQKIGLARNATNWDNLTDYLYKDFDLKRTGLTIESEAASRVEESQLIKRLEKFTAGPVLERKVYYIYVNSWVFTLSTSTPALYDDLDLIAQSFQYFGE